MYGKNINRKKKSVKSNGKRFYKKNKNTIKLVMSF